MMVFQRLTAAAAILFALTAATAHAQDRYPFDPNAPIVATPYRSAFSDYQRYQDPDIASWKAANEEVGQVAGHAGHGGQTKGNASSMPDPDAGQANQRASTAAPSKTMPPDMPNHGGLHQQ